jgi:site-specific DNA recombinase
LPILNNRAYIGKLVWNKLRYVKDPDTRKRRSKANKAEAVIEKDVPHLLVIEQDLWNAVKQRQAEVMLGPRGSGHLAVTGLVNWATGMSHHKD